MDDKELDGKLVYLTVHVDRWLREINVDFNVTMANKLAKVIKVFDWESDEGKYLLRARAKTGKWENLEPKDFKFVLKVYHPDLVVKNKKGCTIEEVLPRCYPGTKLYLFDLLLDELLVDLQKAEKNLLKLTPPKAAVSKRRAQVVRKKVAKKR